MIKFAIVEDDKKDRSILCEMVMRYQKENSLEFDVSVFENGLKFLDAKEKFDIVFFDIMMPALNGMQTAKHLRLNDNDTQIVFITNMEQFAIDGYSVDARAFLIKPATYPDVCKALDKTTAVIINRKEDFILIKNYSEIISLPISSIYYVEVSGHTLIYHTTKGEYRTKGTMHEIYDSKLSKCGFSYCISYAAVNLRHVLSIQKDEVVLPEGTVLKMSRRKKQDFLRDYLSFAGDIKND